ncbi:hypothetical protein MTR72_25620 [Bradyrhizobium sp. ISRA442]
MRDRKRTSADAQHILLCLERVKDSFNSYPLDCLAIAGAIAAIEDDGSFQEARTNIIASREALARELGQLGFEVLPSLANFVFATRALAVPGGASGPASG